MVNKLTETEIKALAAEWHANGEPAHELKLQWIGDAHKNVPGAVSYEDQSAVSREMYALKRLDAIEAFDTTPAIKQYLRDRVRQRGSINPEKADYTAFLKGCAATKSNQWGKAVAPYIPEKGACGIKLQPASAVRVSYTQESYSDDSAVAIPYTVDTSKPHDVATFVRNVVALVRRGDSHTGMAGSGCNYSVGLELDFIIIHCRASIAD